MSNLNYKSSKSNWSSILLLKSSVLAGFVSSKSVLSGSVSSVWGHCHNKKICHLCWTKKIAGREFKKSQAERSSVRGRWSWGRGFEVADVRWSCSWGWNCLVVMNEVAGSRGRCCSVVVKISLFHAFASPSESLHLLQLSLP